MEHSNTATGGISIEGTGDGAMKEYSSSADSNVSNAITYGSSVITYGSHDSSYVSNVTVDECGHEPYDTFKEKARGLILQLHPENTAKDVELKKMHGGSFNRVIGVKIYPPEKDKPKFLMKKIALQYLRKCVSSQQKKLIKPQEYILRIPRNAAHKMKYQVTTLQFVKDIIGYQVPKVFLYDITEDNPLGMGYMIQHRIPGVPLCEVWFRLTFAQQKSATRHIVQILQKTSRITHECPGIVSKDNCVIDLGVPDINDAVGNHIKVGDPQPGQLLAGCKVDSMRVPFTDYNESQFKKPHTFPSKPQTTAQLLINLCERQMDYETAIFPNPMEGDIWKSFILIVKKLHELGFLPDEDMFHFSHIDLCNRNLLVRVYAEEVEVTGVIDWDSAMFAPKFVSHRAPHFLWNADYRDNEDEYQVLDIAETTRKAALKNIFEKVAGPEYLRYAYTPEYILARRMFRHMWRGFQDNSAWIAAARALIADFNNLHPCL